MDFFVFLPLNSRLIVDQKQFEKEYSLELPKLKLGRNEQTFDIGQAFFEHFEYSPVQEGSVKVDAKVQKYTTHLDAQFHLAGQVTLHCDRCTEPYPHSFETDRRVIYSFEQDKEFDTDEVVAVDPDAVLLDLSVDFYDFIMLEVPLRKVPPTKVHKCAPEVLKLIGESEQAENEPEETDPRWEGLEELKKKFDDN